MWLFISWFLHQTTTLFKHLLTCVSLFISWFLHQTTTKKWRNGAHGWLFISWFLHQTTTRVGAINLRNMLFISWFLHQTTTPWLLCFWYYCCLSLDSYIKPQPWARLWHLPSVVYLLIPTSNHNSGRLNYMLQVLFISWFLHQTTTRNKLYPKLLCCLSLDSYIKPQPSPPVSSPQGGCLSLDSYIKPQRPTRAYVRRKVVYLLIPTSNHNALSCLYAVSRLFISWFLHQTTTLSSLGASTVKLFISWFLHQTTTLPHVVLTAASLFISWFLHQTTTVRGREWWKTRLFISWFLHQTTTPLRMSKRCAWLFISWFLHQTTTFLYFNVKLLSCLSLDSYIKPQLHVLRVCHAAVVYLLIPTSNHNLRRGAVVALELFISWFLHQTTTLPRYYSYKTELFISWFLHQTTTDWFMSSLLYSCLSLDSYIKPQLPTDFWRRTRVVYLLIPTSNHNALLAGSARPVVVYLLIPTSNHNGWLKQRVPHTLFISWFLHQTTTWGLKHSEAWKLFISWFLHQTTTLALPSLVAVCCLSLDSYIKPQPIAVNWLIISF